MQVETDRVWKMGGRHRVAIELSVRIPYELEEVTTQGRRRPARPCLWFDVSARTSPLGGFGRWVALIHMIESPRSHRTSTDNVQFRVALTPEIAQALFGRIRPVEREVSLRFRFRGVFRTRRGSALGMAGTDVWGPMGEFSLSPYKPRWVVKAPEIALHTDTVEGLTFELGDALPTPRLELHVESVPRRPDELLDLRWVRHHCEAPARFFLEQARGDRWIPAGLLDAGGRFATEPSEPFGLDEARGRIRAQLGPLAAAGGRFRVRLTTVEPPELSEISEPFDVQVVAIELGAEPRDHRQPFPVHWVAQPFPAAGAVIELQRREGQRWRTIGTLTGDHTFEAAPAEHRRFRLPSPMGTQAGLRLGEPGRAGGELRVVLRADALGLTRSTASFTLPPESDPE